MEFILSLEFRKGPTNSPLAQNSIFGWLIFGNFSYPDRASSCNITTLHVCFCKDLDKSLSKFWELDELSKTPIFSEEEVQCEEHFLQTHSRLESGRYVVRLPFKNDNPVLLPGTAEKVKRIFINSEARISKDPTKFELYQGFMTEYLNYGHMQLAPETPISSYADYISHHPVWRNSSSTSKIRVVFNGSIQASNGLSLNDHLLVGPKLHADISALTWKWRSFRFVYCADVEKMFRQILVDIRDVDHQRIYWRSTPDSPIDSFQLLTVTYGTSCAPFLANQVVKQLAKDEADRFPLASPIALNFVYVDDILFGAKDLETAKELRTQVYDLFMAGGFHLRKWVSNSSELLEGLDAQNHGLACEKTLQ